MVGVDRGQGRRTAMVILASQQIINIGLSTNRSKAPYKELKLKVMHLESLDGRWGSLGHCQNVRGAILPQLQGEVTSKSQVTPAIQTTVPQQGRVRPPA